MKNYIKEYILDNEFRLNMYNDRINIVNYEKLLNISDKEIILATNNSKIYISGNNIVLNKLLDNEILISGNISLIEVKDE